MRSEPPISRELWDQVPPAAQAALAAVLQHSQERLAALEGRVRDLERRLGQNSTRYVRRRATRMLSNASLAFSSFGSAIDRASMADTGMRINSVAVCSTTLGAFINSWNRPSE